VIYVTGDTHGDAGRWEEHIHPVLSDGDIIIVCGDFGVGFWDDGEGFYDRVAARDYTVLFIDGNHENFDKLDSYPVETRFGGRVHVIRHNIIHLMRGEVYDICGQRVFTFGGGYSLDRYMRVENYGWWRRELPDESERLHARESLERAGGEVDCIITHTAPSDAVQYLAQKFRPLIRSDVFQEMGLTGFLYSISQEIRYKRWYFGHFHVDCELWKGQTALMNTVRELETGKIAAEWQGE